MCFGGGGDGGAGAAQEQEAERQGNIRQGMQGVDQAFSGFDKPFYDGQAQAYRDYAQPQVDRQWTDAQQQLHYALDRAGIQNSSAAGKANADAQFTHDQAQQQLEDSAQGTALGTENKVASARQMLDAQLNADANAGEASSNAQAQSALLNMKPAFSPVGNLFQNLTGNLSLYAQGYPLLGTPNYTGALGVGGPSGGGASVFGSPSSSSGAVVH